MARYYSSDIGRFITRDTFHGFEDDPHRFQYAYARNNPVMNVDLNGHYWENAWWNKEIVLVGTINLLLFTIFGGSFALVAKGLKKYAANKLKDAAGRLFATGLKKKLMAKGISAMAASYILNAISVVIGWASFYLSPGETIFKWLDSKDKYPNNHY